MTDDLLERAARAMAHVEGFLGPDWGVVEVYAPQARAVLAIAFEEAAQEAAGYEWILALRGSVKTCMAMDDAACSVQEQIAGHFRAKSKEYAP